MTPLYVTTKSERVKPEFSWEVYTPQFYSQQTSGQEAVEIDALAETLWGVFHPRNVEDVGCGSGRFLRTFSRLGCVVQGIDGPYVKGLGLSYIGSFSEQDFRDGLILPMKDPDLLLCLEVVEHLPPKVADDVVRTIARSRAKAIVFSGAHPGQGGTGHINERPRTYWTEQFFKHGRERDIDATVRVLQRWRDSLKGGDVYCTWYRDNLQVYR